MIAIRHFLEDALFYPCSDLDGAPVMLLAKHIPRFFYVDYLVEHEKLLKEARSPGFAGYQLADIKELEATSVFGISWEEIAAAATDSLRKIDFSWSPKDAFLTFLRFERSPGRPDLHGPPVIELLFARCEAIAMFRAVYTRQQIAPKCVAYIRPGLAFGRNYGDYPKDLQLALCENPAGMPEFLLHDEAATHPRNGAFLQIARIYEELTSWRIPEESYTGVTRLTFRRRPEDFDFARYLKKYYRYPWEE
ncbi:MAG: hypothetical protein ACK5CW_12300 [Verrucomicrobiota bacterium]|jgi:hypothetical protein